MVHLSCLNDGRVPDAFVEGYGLSRMREQLQSIGGTLLAGKDRNGSFLLKAEVPVYYRMPVPEDSSHEMAEGSASLSEGGRRHG